MSVHWEIGPVNDINKSITELDENQVSYLVALCMVNNSSQGRYRGSIAQTLRNIWPEAEADMVNRLSKNIPRHLRRNGFDTVQTPEGFFWIVPATLEWKEQETGGSGKPLFTGKPSESGSVRHSHINLPRAPTARTLYDAIARNPGKHPREYALQIGKSPASVSSAARLLKRNALIYIEGLTIASTYHLANGKTQSRVQKKTVVVVAKPQVDATISHGNGTRILVDKETGEEFTFQNGKLYRSVVVTTLEEVK